LGDVIGQGSGDFGFAYFPTSSVVSLICDMEDGATVEVGLAGNDGVLGTSLFLGGKTTTNRAVVGIAGEAVRVGACLASAENGEERSSVNIDGEDACEKSESTTRQKRRSPS